jgi:hypothetical protein
VEEAGAAQADQFGRRLTAYQQYACNKFGSACRIALAVQRAENPRGACEIYHYNSDGTLDWGYFQINTVHLKRAGVNLRNLLDCKANIDFAYQLYTERGFEPGPRSIAARITIPKNILIEFRRMVGHGDPIKFSDNVDVTMQRLICRSPHGGRVPARLADPWSSWERGSRKPSLSLRPRGAASRLSDLFCSRP